MVEVSQNLSDQTNLLSQTLLNKNEIIKIKKNRKCSNFF